MSISNIVEKTITNIPSSITSDEAELFNSFPTDEVIPVLLKIFNETSDRVIKSRSFDAVLNMVYFDKVDFLIDLYDKSDENWRIVCCRRLADFQDKRSVDKLCEIVVADSNPDVRYVATETLSIIGDTSTIPTLEQVKMHDTGEDYEGFKVADIADKAIKNINKRKGLMT